MIVLGADLSWSRSGLVWLTGYHKVGDYQAIGIKPGNKRIQRAYETFETKIDNLPPSLVIIEDNAYGAPSRVTVVKLSQLNTLMKLVCEKRGIPWLEIAPGMAKKFITGKGTAEKAQVAQELERRWGIKFEKDPGFDLSDAAALACWGLERK